MRYGRFFWVALTLTLAVAVLNGCSVVQLLPSSSCTYVRYERLNDEVEVEALCQV
jgi:hypothetical protein